MQPEGFRFDDVHVDVRAARVLKRDEPVDLEPKAFEVLCFLVRNPGRLVEKRELLDAVWGGTSVTENAMTRVVAHLRRALGDQAHEARYVETVPTRGYRFIADVSPLGTKAGGSGRRAIALAGVAAGLVLGMAVATVMAPAVGDSKPPEPRRLSIVLENLVLNTTHEPVLDLSPDGRTLAFVAREKGTPGAQIYLRHLSSGQLESLPGTEDAHVPFFSPDSRWVGFRQGRQLMKVSVDGGPPLTIGEVSEKMFSASMAADGSVVLSDFSRLVRVRPGAEEEVVTRVNSEAGELATVWPSVLPERRGVLLTVGTGTGSGDRRIDVVDGRTGERRTLLSAGTRAVYAASGHVVFEWNGSLHAAPFDLETLSITGPPTTLMENALADPTKSLSHVAVSADGTLVFLPPADGVVPTLQWLSRDGHKRPVLEADVWYREPSLSPDGRRIAFRDTRRRSSGIWIYDLASGELTRLGLESNPVAIIWLPGSDGFAFASRSGSSWSIFVKYEARDGPAELLRTSDRDLFPKAWSADGSLLAFETETAFANRDVWVMKMDENTEASPLLDGPSDEREPLFSPDGRWLAYQSNETGRYEIFVAKVEDATRRFKVSMDGGREPRWTRGGRQVVFRNGPQLLAAQVYGAEELRFGLPRVVVENDSLHPGPGYRNYDVSMDGERFLIVDFKGDPAQAQVEVLLNWPSLLPGAGS